MNIKYIDYSEKYRDILCHMINRLYIEDPEGEPMSQEKIEATIEYAAENPDSLKIIMICDCERECLDDCCCDINDIIGYAIIQLIWSNEWGGLTANIDEMYIMQKARGRGIATDFIGKVPELLPEINRITLEVTPSNDKAMNLYKRLGFSVAENSTMEKVV